MVVVHHVSEVVAPVIVSFANAHAIVREIDITVVAWTQIKLTWLGFREKGSNEKAYCIVSTWR